MLVKDQLNRSLNLPNVPKRVISLVPSQTELLVDLGLEASVVGVTKFCVHPKHLRKTKTVVGGTKKVHLNRIAELEPDLILCNKEENTKEMVEALRSIAPVHLSDIISLESALELIEMYGEIFRVREASSELVNGIIAERQKFKHNQIQTKRNVAYFIWKDPWMVAAKDTFINHMLSEAGFINVFASEYRYPEIPLNDPRLQEAESIFLSSEPFPFKQLHVDAIKSRFPDKEVRVVDGEMFSWYGSRLLKAYTYFAAL
jgi:ABC-type Fe3+-hydroxamate transport system substrate-binding protein